LFDIRASYYLCGLYKRRSGPGCDKGYSYALEKLIPWSDPNYAHAEGNSAAHIRSSIIGNSRVVPIEDGELTLGTWESIFLAEFDGPRERKIIIKVIPC
jgi:secondary thiamine-phosphate synthase enzyme